MNFDESSFIKRIMYKYNRKDLLYNTNDSYKLAKQKNKKVYVFYKNDNVIILDKRNKYTNVYIDLDSASKKLCI
jgi:hypothetical protein